MTMTNPAAPPTLLEVAMAWHDAGCAVLPVTPDGSKSPGVPSWRHWQSARPGPDQLGRWFTDGATDGLGVICGAVSGNLEMFEAEGRAVADGILAELATAMTDNALGQLWERVTGGYCELTPSGGMHWLYRVDGPARPNLKLARRPGATGGVEVLLETRGEGGFTVVAGSGGRSHPTGRAWIAVTGSPASIPTLTIEERDALHAVASLLDRMPVRDVATPAAAREQPGGRPGDDFNARATWRDILTPHGWRPVRRFAGNGVGWLRPGKEGPGISATTGTREGDRLYVFSTSTVFDAETPYSKFGAWALLEHGGDHAAAARELRRRGYGEPAATADRGFDGLVPPSVRRTEEQPWSATASTTGSTSPPMATQSPSSTASAAEPGEAADPTRDRTSWWPRDLAAVLAGTGGEPEPSHLAREDGRRLFYAAKVNGLIGESESGKTWVALLAVVQALAGAEQVVYLDFEDVASGIVARLRSLGVPDEQLARLAYIGPDESLHLAASADLSETLEQLRPGLIVLDGFNAAMTLLGLDLNSNTDATKFAQTLLRPLAATGACVVYVDHVPKNVDNRGKGGIGAQAKRAMTTGCALRVDVVKPFGRGMTGRLKLWVDKDRPGHVRAAAGGATYAGTAELVSDGDSGMVTVRVQEPDSRPPEERPKFRPTHLMQRVSQLLASLPEGASKSAIEAEIGGKASYVRGALDCLIEEGYVTTESLGNGRAITHKLARPYFEINDLIEGSDGA